jgi:cytochrome c
MAGSPRQKVVRVAVLVTSGAVVLAGGPAGADRERGRDVFRQHCIGCHAVDCNRLGPRLGGVIDRQAGTVADFAGYSAAMKSSSFVWSKEVLDAFLADPGQYLPGTAMSGFGKLDRAADRRDVIAFLAHPDTSLDLCF